MESWIKPGLDVMLKSFAEYLEGSLTYVKHPTDESVHNYYINIPEMTVVLCFTEIPGEVHPVGGESLN